jgi:DNA-binding phage protein
MNERLRAEHLIAIQFLALPKKGRFTMQQIAEKCGVSRQTLYEWLKMPIFESELKKQMIRNTRERLPEAIASMVDHVVNDGNAAMMKLLLQMNDMLTDKVSVEQKLTNAGDVDAMKQRIEEFKNKELSGK